MVNYSIKSLEYKYPETYIHLCCLGRHNITLVSTVNLVACGTKYKLQASDDVHNCNIFGRYFFIEDLPPYVHIDFDENTYTYNVKGETYEAPLQALKYHKF